MSQTIIIDLDDTICFPNHGYKDSHNKYALAIPNEQMIESMRIAKDKGYRIVIYTARRMLTHNGDVEAIIKDVGDITTKWLKDHNVIYDELIYGKPYAEYYVDDKALRPTDFIRMINE
jgi:capsule biosynthesis phosphatase